MPPFGEQAGEVPRRRNGYAELALASVDVDEFLLKGRRFRLRVEAWTVDEPRLCVVAAIVAWWSVNPSTGARVPGERYYISSSDDERRAGIHHASLREALDAALRRVREADEGGLSAWDGSRDIYRPLGGRITTIGYLHQGKFVSAKDGGA